MEIMSKYIVLGGFLIILSNMAISGIVMKIRKQDFKGSAPINDFLFKSVKATSFYVWIIFILEALIPGKIESMPGMIIQSHPVLKFIASIVLLVSAFVIVVTFRLLRTSLKFGLPSERSFHFETRSIYRFSRNPMYLAFAFINMAACIYYPNIFVIIAAFFSIFVHHLIIISEEKFLKKILGSKYLEYQKRTRRYL